MRLDFRFISSLVLAVILFGSCNNTVVEKKTGIFDFQSFFTKEASLLKANNTGLNKTIIDKENVFSNVEKLPDWEKELAVFKTFSLIKPEQENQYEVDTLKSERGFEFITYSAENPKLRLQLAEVMYNTEHAIEKITLVVKSSDIINNSDITLTYLPSRGYDIKGDINSMIGGSRFLDIHVECLK